MTGEGWKVHMICEGAEQKTTMELEKPDVAVSVPATEALPPEVMVTEFAEIVPLNSAIQNGKLKVRGIPATVSETVRLCLPTATPEGKFRNSWIEVVEFLTLILAV